MYFDFKKLLTDYFPDQINKKELAFLFNGVLK